jgi:uncharacterized protein (DUF488 family)
MFSRQRALLRLIDNEGGSIARLRLVKLAFLLSREAEAPRAGLYNFVPYKHGPFSFTLYHELRVLGRDGWVAEQEHNVKTAEAPHLETAFLDKGFLALIDNVSNCYRPVPTPALLDRVYHDYPWFTLNSEATQKRAVSRPTAIPAVYTVGYEGIMVDALLDCLLHKGIKRLIDVRCNPIARRYGFHKATLCKLCSDLGIEYMHFPALGVPSVWRAELHDQSAYERLFERYEREILPKQRPAVEKVANLVMEMPSALMCMEAAHTCCHRSRLGAEVSRQTSLPVVELREA